MGKHTKKIVCGAWSEEVCKCTKKKMGSCKIVADINLGGISTFTQCRVDARVLTVQNLLCLGSEDRSVSINNSEGDLLQQVRIAA